MGYRGMVVISNEDFGESMELINCIKKAVCKLTDKLSEAEMGYRHREEDDEYDEEEMDMMYNERMSGRGHGKSGRRMPIRGRYGY